MRRATPPSLRWWGTISCGSGSPATCTRRASRRGAVVDARLESPGVVMARLLPPKKPDAQAEPSKLWPLPVTGKVAVRAGFMEFAQKRVEPVEGTLVLEPERARLDLQQAKMCGV